MEAPNKLYVVVCNEWDGNHYNKQNIGIYSRVDTAEMACQSRPLFSVGEKVALTSLVEEDKKFEGVYTVRRVLSFTEVSILLGASPGYSNDFYYILDNLVWDNEYYNIVGEVFLHKLHRPSTFSFSELINTLKSPEKV